jgi:uncharacterized protein
MIYKKRIQPFTALLSFYYTNRFATLQYRKPDFQTSVYDYANVLVHRKNTIRRKLINYDTTTTQIVVITIESLKGEDIGILPPKWDKMGNRN